MKRELYGPQGCKMFGSGHITNTFAVYEPGLIAVLGEKNPVGASNVINAWVVRSVQFMLHITLMRVRH